MNRNIGSQPKDGGFINWGEYAEAYRRDALPSELKGFYEEAMRRGLVPGADTRSETRVDRLLAGEEIGTGTPKQKTRVDRILEGEETNWARTVFEGPTETKETPQNWAREMFEKPEGLTPIETEIGGKKGTFFLQTEEEPTGAIDTRTGKPIMRSVIPKDTKRASFGALSKAGIVDDPETKMDILSKEMRIPRDRFGMVSGNIVYQADDGILYRVVTPDLGGKAKAFAADTVAHSPEIALSTALVPTGPWGVAAGAAGGAGIRKSIGHLVFDEPQTISGNLVEMGKAAGTSFIGEKLGGKLVSGIDLSRGRQGARILKAAGRGRERISLPEVREAENLGQQYGVRLLPPQTTRSPELISRFNLLGDLPETADLIGAARRGQHDKVVTAIDDFLSTIAKPTSPGEAGRRGVEAAKGAMEAPYLSARGASRDLYEEARQVRGVGISNTVQKIDGMLGEAPTGGQERKTLQRIRNMLVRKETDAAGKTVEVAEDRVFVLDKVKKEINAMWKADPKTAPEKETQRSINQVLEDMLASVDDQVPAYKAARAAFKEKLDATGVDELKKTKIAEIARLEGDKVEKAAKMLFSPGQSSPEIVSISKPMIIKYGGQDAWDSLIRTHLSEIFDLSNKAARSGGVKNLGGMFFENTVGDPRQMKILEAALSKEQLENIKNFGKVLERTGLILGRESTTATRLRQLSKAEDEYVPGTLRYLDQLELTKPGTWVGANILIARLKTAFTEQGRIRLAEAMLSEKGARELRSMLQLQPESQTLIKRLSTFLTTTAGGYSRRDVEEAMQPDILPRGLIMPPTIQGKSSRPGIVETQGKSEGRRLISPMVSGPKRQSGRLVLQ